MTWPPQRRYGITRQLVSQPALEDVIREVWRERVPGYDIIIGRLATDGPPLIVIHPTRPRRRAYMQVSEIPRWPDVLREVTYFSTEHLHRDRREFAGELDDRIVEALQLCRHANGDSPWEP